MESSIVCTCKEAEFENAVKGWKSCLDRYPYSKMQDGNCFVEVDNISRLPIDINELSVFQNSKLFSYEIDAHTDAFRVSKEKKSVGAACYVRNVAGIPPGGKMRVKKANTLAKKRKRFEMQEGKIEHKISTAIQKMKDKFLDSESNWIACGGCECKIVRSHVKIHDNVLTCPVCNHIFHFPELDKVKEFKEALTLVRNQKNNIINPIGWKLIYST